MEVVEEVAKAHIKLKLKRESERGTVVVVVSGRRGIGTENNK